MRNASFRKWHLSRTLKWILSCDRKVYQAEGKRKKWALEVHETARWQEWRKRPRVLFLPPSYVYVSFLYLLYTLIKIYYTKALSNQASSLAPDWILLLWRPRIPASLCDSATTFHLGSSSRIFQDKAHSYTAYHNRPNCWVCGALPSSSVEGFPWWTSPLQGKNFLQVCKYLQQQSHVMLLLKPMTSNYLKMNWCNYGHNVTFHFDFNLV